MRFSEAVEDKSKEGAAPATVVKPLDIEGAKKQFAWVDAELDKLAEQAKAITVEGETSLSIAIEMAGNAKQLSKKITAEGKRIFTDPEKFVKSVKGFCKMFTEKLTTNAKKTNTDCIELVLKKKISDYQYQQELERRKQEEAARKAAEELQERLHKEAEEANRKTREEAIKKAEAEAKAQKLKKAEIEDAKKKAEEEARAREVEAPTVIEPVVPQVAKVARAESGASSHLRKTWKGEIEDEAKVPREYCEASQRLVTVAVRAGIRKIPGVRIFEHIDSTIRT